MAHIIVIHPVPCIKKVVVLTVNLMMSNSTNKKYREEGEKIILLIYNNY
jgi:hypothetical protein